VIGGAIVGAVYHEIGASFSCIAQRADLSAIRFEGVRYGPMVWESTEITLSELREALESGR
jgi:hypothetical protein